MIGISWFVIVHFSAKLVDLALASGKIFEGRRWRGGEGKKES